MYSTAKKLLVLYLTSINWPELFFSFLIHLTEESTFYTNIEYEEYSTEEEGDYSRKIWVNQYNAVPSPFIHCFTHNFPKPLGIWDCFAPIKEMSHLPTWNIHFRILSERKTNL